MTRTAARLSSGKHHDFMVRSATENTMIYDAFRHGKHHCFMVRSGAESTMKNMVVSVTESTTPLKGEIFRRFRDVTCGYGRGPR